MPPNMRHVTGGSDSFHDFPAVPHEHYAKIYIYSAWENLFLDDDLDDVDVYLFSNLLSW